MSRGILRAIRRGERLRKLIYFLIATIACCVFLWLASWSTRPSLQRRPSAYTAAEIAEAVAARDVKFDSAHPPTVILDRVVHPTGQSPILAELEHAGLLPPLAARIPDEPVVMQGCDGIGKYGGTLMQLSATLSDLSIFGWRSTGPYLVRWSPCGYPIEPYIAKSVVPSADRRQWIVTLRRGLRWSDGAPFTADDIMFWWSDDANDTTVNSLPPPWMSVEGEYGTVDKIDDYHVRFSFAHPYPLFLESIAFQPTPVNFPAHYLRQFHPRLGDLTLIKKFQQMYALPNAKAVYSYMHDLYNADCPRLWPWVYRNYAPASPQVFVRNPYYFAVDTAGNQLPYTDRVQFQIVDASVLPISAANGDSSMQFRSIRYSDFTELMSRRAISGTRVLQWYPSVRSPFVINPNLNRRVTAKDPASRWKAQLLNDRRFRQALSLAIDRAAIIRADYNGQCEPSQVEPGPLSPFHSERLQRAFTQYDPQHANQLLDDLGLNHRDTEGFRTFPDGTRMTFFFDFNVITGIGPSQFIADDWAAVGVRIVVRERSRQLFTLEKDAELFDFDIWTSESDLFPLLSPRVLVPIDTEAIYGAAWARWFIHGGFFGKSTTDQKNAAPVPSDSPMFTALTDFFAAKRAVDLNTQQAMLSKVCDIAAENLWTIAISTSPPDLVVIQKDLRNVPTVAVTGQQMSSPSNTCMETYFFEHPHDSLGAIAQTRDAILHPTLRPAAVDPDASIFHRVLLALPALFVIAVVGAMGFKYPYVGRRLAIMVPTLLAISLIVFVIIQLPPGDFLSTKVLQLEEVGDPDAASQINDLRDQFHFEDAGWMKYMRWMGVRWFFTFRSSDAGLLQGNLGRSMATTQLVNQMIGDRLTFTVLLSLTTMLITWTLAIPIGIYSAVRPYTFSDYLLTLFGFVGMCVPGFLFALVLMAISGVSGLFSAEFATQPEWSWLKILDLLKHAWIPLVVLGAGGTAGMIRVMRANLLDELRRPYVTTAVAKGMRPFRLLMKYPVRMSLNPFISGIGGLFPALISGGSIVSIVLSLPTIGPLMLDALRDQDMYLAGSLLVLLNALSVFGTLISDLMLLWVDPRIRVSGGTR